MCLGDVGQVIAVATDGTTADVSIDGRPAPLDVPLLALDRCVAVGDWVVVHLGVAVAVLEEDEARDALATTAAMRATEVEP